MHRIAVIAGVLTLAACAPQDGPEIAPNTQSSSLANDQSEPLLALMDHMLGNYFASDVARRPSVCASQHDGRSEVSLTQDAELALMTRYDALAPFSRCAWIDNAWQDSETGDPAMVFNVHSFTCADAEHCTGFGAYISGESASISSRYSMSFEGRTWSFERDPRIIGDQ